MKKFLLILIILVSLSILSLLAFSFIVNRPANNVSQNFTISSGEGVNQISANLKNADLLKCPLAFEMLVWLKDIETKFIASEHAIPENISISGLIRILTTTSQANEIQLQFIEGWTVNDYIEYLLTENVITSEDEFNKLNKAKLWSDKYSFLHNLPPEASLEGYLFPDTYNFFKDATVEDIITKQLDNFDKKFNQELRLILADQGKSIHDTIILASILEKEVKTTEDMKMVADIFYKRLEMDIALQADSTLNYAIGGTNASLTSDELQIDSPYNSYKYRGLPPTPISNPGLNAIEAAVNPTPNEFYFFLTSPEGKTYYGKTLDEHKANRQYL